MVTEDEENNRMEFWLETENKNVSLPVELIGRFKDRKKELEKLTEEYGFSEPSFGGKKSVKFNECLFCGRSRSVMIREENEIE